MFYKCSGCSATRFVSNRELKRLTIAKKNHAISNTGEIRPRCERCSSFMNVYNPEGKVLKNAPHVFR